jgi:hypothetical protein
MSGFLLFGNVWLNQNVGHQIAYLAMYGSNPINLARLIASANFL